MFKIFYFIDAKLTGFRWKFRFAFYRSFYGARVAIAGNVHGHAPSLLLDSSSSSVAIGELVSFRGESFFHAFDGGRIQISDRVFFNRGCSLNALEEISIGTDCLFAENVSIWDHDHRFTDKLSKISGQGYTSKPVRIGNNCWLGTNVVVLKGVTIGDGVIIAAGSVVTKNVPSNETWGGVPARKLNSSADEDYQTL